MARIGWGFEVGTLTAVEELGWNTDRLAMSNQAVGDSGGDWSVTISGASISGPRTPTLASAKYVGFAVEPITSPTEFVVIFESGTTAQCSVLFKTDGSVDLYRGDRFGGTLIDSSGVIYNPAAVNWVEIEVVAANSGTVELQINGASVYTYSGDTQDSGSSGWTRVRLADVFVAASVRVDNVTLGDNTETWIGTLPLVQVKRPTSVASGNLVGNPTTGANRYQNVDGNPFSTTDYNEGTSIGDADVYGTNTLPDPIDSVVFVAVFVEGERAGAITGLELGTKGSGAVTYQTAQTLPGSGFGCLGVWLPEDPDTSAAWTESAVDALSVAVRLA